MMQIEVIVQSAAEAKEAENLGADRLELVTAIDEGGLTPAFDIVDEVLRTVSIPVQVMIRPHSRGFHYDSEVMKEVMTSIRDVDALGGKGIVFGALTGRQLIDEEAIKAVMQAYPSLDITFHKAFDQVKDQIDAYRTLTKYHQIKRILTSGGARNCTEGMEQLKILRDLRIEKGGPEIMPGAGLDPDNIGFIHRHVQAEQYHFGQAIRKQSSYDQSFSKEALQTIYSQTKRDKEINPEH